MSLVLNNWAQIPILVHYANSAHPVQMQQNVASDQGQHSLHTGISMQNKFRMYFSQFIHHILFNVSANQNRNIEQDVMNKL